MQIEVRLTNTPLRRWHLELIERLAAVAGTQVGAMGPAVRPRAGSEADRIERVFTLECLLHRVSRGLGEPLDPQLLENRTQANPVPDVLLDLTDDPDERASTWRLTFDGRSGELAAIEALRRGEPPLVAIVAGDGSVLAVARPGSETPGVLAAAFDDLLAGVTTLILKAIEGLRSTRPVSLPEPEPDRAAPRSLGLHAFGQIAGSVAHRGYRALYRAPHWRVGWRFVDGPGLLDDPETAARSSWQTLPDDGHRFYADPFPFVHDGELLLFVEDYEHRLGRGVISMVRFDENGPAHVPSPVLRHRVHLSYPFVFDHDGEVWMIPETSAAGTVELYRAVRFPDEWVLETTLVDQVEASDATVFQHHGRWWMMATVRSGGSFSDALSLWSAERLSGPWIPHRDNPVLIDIASARPAGRVEHRDGVLLRPVQDCRSGYGAALAVAEITSLDDGGFDQQVLGHLSPGTWWPGRRLHTLNRAGRLETIDGSAMAPRFWSRREEAR